MIKQVLDDSNIQEDNNLDHLVQENSELHDQINSLKKIMKDQVS